jgi:hypothetical protein
MIAPAKDQFFILKCEMLKSLRTLFFLLRNHWACKPLTGCLYILSWWHLQWNDESIASVWLQLAMKMWVPQVLFLYMFLLIDLTMKMWIPQVLYICSCWSSSSGSILLYFVLPEPKKAIDRRGLGYFAFYLLHFQRNFYTFYPRGKHFSLRLMTWWLILLHVFIVILYYRIYDDKMMVAFV